MTYQHHVFLSYSRKDTAMMQHVRDDLRASGLTVWTDEGLEVGTPSWTRDIDQAIRNTGCLVVLLSPDAYQSEWVGREIAFAQTHKKRIFPMLVRGDDTNAIPFDLARHNYVDIRTDYVVGIERVIRDISKYLSISEPQSPLILVLPSDSIYESPLSQYATPSQPKHLQALNPFDWVKLLSWILINPKKWLDYCTLQGKRPKFSDEPTLVWLSSTLTWLPIFWLILGISINTIPIITSYEWVRYLFFIIPVLWVLTGLVGKDASSFGVFIIIVIVALAMSIGLILGLVDSSTGVLVAILAMSLGFVTIISVTNVLPALIVGLIVGFVLAFAASIFKIFSSGGIISAIVILGGFGVIGFVVPPTIEYAHLKKSPTWTTKLIFLTLIASHAFLIWYCLLGGYQVLN